MYFLVSDYHFSKWYTNSMKISEKWFNPVYVCQQSLKAGVALVGLHILVTLVAQSTPLFYWFSLNTEKNIPTIYATLIMYGAAVTLGHLAKQDTPQNPFHWKTLSIVFFVLATDEWFSIHDVLGKAISEAVFAADNPLSGHWTAVYIPLCLIFAISFVPFLLKLPRKTAGWMILSGVLFVTGAILFEEISAPLNHLPLFELAVFEEAFEFAGILLFWHTLNRYSDALGITQSFAKKPLYWVVGFMVIDTLGTTVAPLLR